MTYVSVIFLNSTLFQNSYYYYSFTCGIVETNRDVILYSQWLYIICLKLEILSNVKYVYHVIFHIHIFIHLYPAVIFCLFVQGLYDNQPVLSDNHQINVRRMLFKSKNTQNNIKLVFRLPSYHEQKVLSVSALKSYDITWLQ